MATAKTTRTPVLAVIMPSEEREPIQELAKAEERSESAMGRILIREALAARAAVDNSINRATA